MMEKLEDYVAGLFGVRTTDLFTTTRKREVVDARKVCMATMRDFTSASLSTIAGYFNMEHCSTIYAVREVKKLYHTDKDFKSKVDHVYDRCNSKTLMIPFTFEQIIYDYPMEEEYLTAVQ